MKKNIAVSYAFDNEFQASIMFRSILSLYKDGLNSDIPVIIGITPRLFCEFENKIIDFFKLNNFDMDNLILINCNFDPGVKSGKGMFYYLSFPFITDFDYILKIDNDTFLQKVDVKELINYSSFNNGAITGIYTQQVERENYKNLIISFIGKKKYDRYSSNYMNCGILLINVDKYKKMIGSQKRLIKKVGKINNKLWELKEEYNFWPDNDQLILFILFNKDISSILPKRMNRNYILPNVLANNDFDNSIYHFAYWIPKVEGNGIWKVNVYDFFNSKDKEPDFMSFWPTRRSEDFEFLKLIKKQNILIWEKNKFFLNVN